MTTRVNFRLPDELLDKADVAAAATHKNRTEIVVAALQEYLDEMEDQETFKQTVVDLYLDDEIGFDALKEVFGRQDAESVRASKTLLEQGDEMADDLAQL
ncbi:CopG family transcriptional regulator [Haloarcula sp. JP-Z28]|uniref:ribbon-helix-helix protein, CopG family n=1 Tax=Haloarcula sp. JP-Z28 TaxID=2716715 RepID=UPI001404CE57|nr:ribbon-helix-helix protein, CopG family [Haloarcula sp. JP-Z28]NHN65340.1 CopG family transcriptional regulator [Haloarcula sp. JP-Z28]